MTQLERLKTAVYESNKYFVYCREALKHEKTVQEVLDQASIAQKACLEALDEEKQ